MMAEEKKETFDNPVWVSDLRNHGIMAYFTTANHTWIPFHKWGFLRFPTNDMAPVSRAEEKELFKKARAKILSYAYPVKAGDKANAVLYVCDDKNYDIEKLSPNNRSKVRRGIKRHDVRKVSPTEIAKKGYQPYHDTATRNGVTPISKEEFERKWGKNKMLPSWEIWAAYSGDEIAAMGTVWLCGKYAELFGTSSANAFLKDYPNHALFYTVLKSLIQRDEIESVSYGLSSVQPNSKLNSLHHFKQSVNLRPIPVVRHIKVIPWLRPAINPLSLTILRLLERRVPGSKRIKAARGAMELLVRGEKAAVTFEEKKDGIHPIIAQDILALAQIHRKIFADYRSSKLGVRFCKKMFTAYVSDPGAIGFLLWRGGKRVGYVVGGADSLHQKVNSRLRNEAIKAILARPWFLVKEVYVRVLNRLKKYTSHKPKPVANNNPAQSKKKKSAKLILIGLVEEARGTGAAAELLNAFVNRAKELGYAEVNLMVASNNKRAQAAYEKAGWKLVDSSGDSYRYGIPIE
jgi:ribosomal protein S18 acetylase RimI-like enzyme